MINENVLRFVRVGMFNLLKMGKKQKFIEEKGRDLKTLEEVLIEKMEKMSK